MSCQQRYTVAHRTCLTCAACVAVWQVGRLTLIQRIMAGAPAFKRCLLQRVIRLLMPVVMPVDGSQSDQGTNPDGRPRRGSRRCGGPVPWAHPHGSVVVSLLFFVLDHDTVLCCCRVRRTCATNVTDSDFAEETEPFLARLSAALCSYPLARSPDLAPSQQEALTAIMHDMVSSPWYAGCYAALICPMVDIVSCLLSWIRLSVP